MYLPVERKNVGTTCQSWEENNVLIIEILWKYSSGACAPTKFLVFLRVFNRVVHLTQGL